MGQESETSLFEAVLLLEDDVAHALIIKRALKGLAGRVKHVETVSAASQALADSSFDLIVSDLHLPDTSAVSDIAALIEKNNNGPLVVLTSSTSLSNAVEAMKLGARDFIVKNFESDFTEVLRLSLSRVYSALQLEAERNKLQKEMEVLQVAIENSNDGLAVVDQRGEIRYANRYFSSFVKRCGGESGNVVSMFSKAVNQHQALKEKVRTKLEALPLGAVWNTEVSFVDSENQAFDFSLSTIGQQEESGKTAARDCVVWVRDVSEVKRREKFQREILSTTSHDLKGPLGAISLSSELLIGMLEKGQKDYEIALRIGSSAQGAINLIDEFLSARRIQEGTFILKPVESSIGDLIAEVVENFSTIAAAKQITFHVEYGEEGTACVDRLGLSRVLGNLLSNAMKFTPKQGQVWLRAFIGDDDEFHLEVEDTGSGMEASEVQRIFERFSRLERHDEIAGTGLGLFVVKSIVSAHGGKVEVTSQIGKGTLFRLSFPRNPPVNQRGELISLDFA